MNSQNDDYLATPEAIRERCNKVFAYVESGQSKNFIYHADKFDTLLQYIDPGASSSDWISSHAPTPSSRPSHPQGDAVAGISSHAPTTSSRPSHTEYDAVAGISSHGRMTHFAVGGVDRIGRFLQSRPATDLIELIIISVLLDAGAGQQWHYHDPTTQQTFRASEGLAVASYNLYMQDAFAMPDLLNIDAQTLGLGLQVTSHNPILGLDARVENLHRLANAIANKDYFPQHKLSDLLQYWRAESTNNVIDMHVIFTSLLDICGIWDVWQHPIGEVPLHKLIQWLCYSLIVPLEMCDLLVSNAQILTALAEYRNGGLLVDLGVITAKDPNAAQSTYAIDSEFVIEWRALTVVLLDQVAAQLQIPMQKLLQLTWTAGRKIAHELRADGSPPFKLANGGTFF